MRCISFIVHSYVGRCLIACPDKRRKAKLEESQITPVQRTHSSSTGSALTVHIYVASPPHGSEADSWSSEALQIQRDLLDVLIRVKLAMDLRATEMEGCRNIAKRQRN